MPFRIVSAIIAACSLAAANWVAAHPLTQRDVLVLPQISDAHVSPDGKWAVYTLATLEASGTKRANSVWVVSTDGKSPPVKWLEEGSNPRWGADGRAIYYLFKDQVWHVCTDCRDKAPRQVTDLPLEVGSFRLAPDGRHIVVSMAVFPDNDDPVATKARLDRKASMPSGRLYDRLFVRHWDVWADGRKNHLFSLVLNDGVATGAAAPLMKAFDGDCPNKPFGNDENYAISPDGQRVAFSAQVAGRTEAWSTNFDIYSVPIDGSSEPSSLTSQNKAWDATPVFSPDGRLLAYGAMKRPGFESDRLGVTVYDLAAKDGREIDPQWDRSAVALAFSGNGKSLYLLAADTQNQKVFAMDVGSGKVKPLTGTGAVRAFSVAHGRRGDTLVYIHSAINHPAEVYAINPGGTTVQLTHVAERQLTDVQMSAYESFSFPGWNNETVRGWVVRPTGWKPGAKFPAVLMIHGGPQGSSLDGWSERWNPEVVAGWGYGVVMIDFHGSTGYGQAFTDSISGHWGDRPLEDLQKGWAAAQAQYPWIDGSRACAAGASFGGYMIYWIAGVWNGPWKCLIDHDGLFDNRDMGYATEELWFSEWENGGLPVWVNPAGYEKFDPLQHVADWTRPTLIIHSDLDFRIPVAEGVAAFTALQRKGVPSEFLNFPDENHLIRKPQNLAQWYDTVQAWLAKWIGPRPGP
jgi:acylaminoacyl-peptidase